MLKYKNSNVTAKRGVNFVRTVVEGAGSLFHKIESDSDIGVDGFIELIRDETPLNRQIAVQIKSGQSFYSAAHEECLIPVGNHRQYWARHPLEVLGIVYIPEFDTAHWVDIKSYFKRYPVGPCVRFTISEANRFDEATFRSVFLPTMIHEVPAVEFGEAMKLLGSAKPDEACLGLVVLFRRYPNVLDAWDRIVEYFRRMPIAALPGMLVYFLAHIPWHGDICGYGEQISPITRNYVKGLFQAFTKDDVVKLLGCIDPDGGISRGTIGQSVEAIVSSLDGAESILAEVVLDSRLDIYIRECAAMIYAMKAGKAALPAVSQLAAATDSWYAKEIVDHVVAYGGFNPYG